jgi:SH3-like domain-containing protein
MPKVAFRLFALAPAVLAALLWSAPTPRGDEPKTTKPETLTRPSRPGRTGLPLPRFVSLRSGEVNLRTGPGVRYPIDWVYRRRHLPVEVIDEFDTWRRIRDWQGTVGWVHQSMLQGRRTILVVGERRLIYRDPQDDAPGLAYAEPGAIGRLSTCRGDWCEIDIKGFTGWLRRSDFFGVYDDEKP